MMLGRPAVLSIPGIRTDGKPRRGGIPEYEDNGRPYMEYHCQTDDIRTQKFQYTQRNHRAKILAKKYSRKLYEVIERLKKIFEQKKAELICGENFTAAKAPRKEGKGYEYPAIGHVVGLEEKVQGDRKWLLHLAEY